MKNLLVATWVLASLLVTAGTGSAQQGPPPAEQDAAAALGFAALAAAAAAANPTSLAVTGAAAAALDAAERAQRLSLSDPVEARRSAWVAVERSVAGVALNMSSITDDESPALAPLQRIIDQIAWGGPSFAFPPLGPALRLDEPQTISNLRGLAQSTAALAPSLTYEDARNLAGLSTSMLDAVSESLHGDTIERLREVKNDTTTTLTTTVRLAQAAAAFSNQPDLEFFSASDILDPFFAYEPRVQSTDQPDDLRRARFAAVAVSSAAARSVDAGASDLLPAVQKLLPAVQKVVVGLTGLFRETPGWTMEPEPASRLIGQAVGDTVARTAAMTCATSAARSGQSSGYCEGDVSELLAAVGEGAIDAGRALGLPPQVTASHASAAIAGAAVDLSLPVGVLLHGTKPADTENLRRSVVGDWSEDGLRPVAGPDVRGARRLLGQAAAASLDAALRLGFSYVDNDLAGTTAGLAAPRLLAIGAAAGAPGFAFDDSRQAAARVAAQGALDGLRGSLPPEGLARSIAQAAAVGAGAAPLRDIPTQLQEEFPAVARAAAQAAAGAAREGNLPPQVAASAAADAAALAPAERIINYTGLEIRNLDNSTFLDRGPASVGGARIVLPDSMLEGAARESARAASEAARELGVRNPGETGARAAGRAAAVLLDASSRESGFFAYEPRVSADEPVQRVMRLAEGAARGAGLSDAEVRRAGAEGRSATEQIQRCETRPLRGGPTAPPASATGCLR